MNTGTRGMVDSEKKEKKVWARPVLTRLDVKETAVKGRPCSHDAAYTQNVPVCNS